MMPNFGGRNYFYLPWKLKNGDHLRGCLGKYSLHGAFGMVSTIFFFWFLTCPIGHKCGEMGCFRTGGCPEMRRQVQKRGLFFLSLWDLTSVSFGGSGSFIQFISSSTCGRVSLKQTFTIPENGWLEYEDEDLSFCGVYISRAIFRCELAVMLSPLVGFPTVRTLANGWHHQGVGGGLDIEDDHGTMKKFPKKTWGLTPLKDFTWLVHLQMIGFLKFGIY